MRIPVEEVARNKSMKDEWPLLEADKGDIQLRWVLWLSHSCVTAPMETSGTHLLSCWPMLELVALAACTRRIPGG